MFFTSAASSQRFRAGGVLGGARGGRSRPNGKRERGGARTAPPVLLLGLARPGRGLKRHREPSFFHGKEQGKPCSFAFQFSMRFGAFAFCPPW